MADRMLFISWAEPVRGSEARALEVFDQALGLMGRMQQEGRIERFEVAITAPNGELGGFMVVNGTADQITALREDEEFQRNTVDAQLAVNGIRHLEGWMDDGVAGRMAMYREAVGKVPQRA
jgi:hypothetical protein